MKVTKNRWDEDVRSYKVEAGKAGWIDVGVRRSLSDFKMLEPFINATATGPIHLDEATHFMLALKKALQLAKQLKKTYTGK